MFSWASVPVDDMYNQIMACSRQERILPDVVVDGDAAASNSASHGDGSSKPKAILIASLQADYRQDPVDVLRARGQWRRHGGGVQPSHEAADHGAAVAQPEGAGGDLPAQLLRCAAHHGASTFGYVSSSLAGLRPTMLMVPKTTTVRCPSRRACVQCLWSRAST
ncbi:hypothetical protein ZWY2020_046449 [Hordeum vulgare]|nr:hypothetical protein ZWY2020_046449 [Hordeum vulgare]